MNGRERGTLNGIATIFHPDSDINNLIKYCLLNLYPFSEIIQHKAWKGSESISNNISLVIADLPTLLRTNQLHTTEQLTTHSIPLIITSASTNIDIAQYSLSNFTSKLLPLPFELFQLSDILIELGFK